MSLKPYQDFSGAISSGTGLRMLFFLVQELSSRLEEEEQRRLGLDVLRSKIRQNLVLVGMARKRAEEGASTQPAAKAEALSSCTDSSQRRIRGHRCHRQQQQRSALARSGKPRTTSCER